MPSVMGLPPGLGCLLPMVSVMTTLDCFCTFPIMSSIFAFELLISELITLENIEEYIDSGGIEAW
jgi:hypothetical protein